MDLLPIQKIREEDVPLFGVDLINLARLEQNNFPIPRGVVALPPELRLRTLLKHHNLKDRELFEQSLTIIKKEIEEIPPPEELSKVLKKERVDDKKLWGQLLQIWLEEIRNRIWRGGLSTGLTLGLSAQPIFFIKKVTGMGKAWFDPIEQAVLVETTSGDLTHREKLEQLVRDGNKLLFLPQTFHWIEDEGNLKIVRLTAYTPHPPSLGSDIVEAKKERVLGDPKSGVKVFLELPNELTISHDLDGVLIKGEKFHQFDQLVFRLVEAAEALPSGVVLFRLSDLIDSHGGVRGTLRLVHQSSLLNAQLDAFLFARHKKKLLNIQIAVPFVRSSEEFLQIKRDLAVKGISRKGTLKLWMEVGVPENLINIEDYLVAGLDGLIINLDELSSWLGGFDNLQPESSFYKKQINALIKFIEDGLRTAHKSKIPIIFSGSLSLHDEILKVVVTKGIWGVVTDIGNSHNLSEHLRRVERRHLSN